MNFHKLNGYIQNIFIVEYDHGCILLDGCCRADYALIRDYFRDVLNRPISDLKLIVVTHMHPDHAGCALKLKLASGAKIVMGNFDTHWYSGFLGRIFHLADLYLALWVASRMGKKKANLWYNPKLIPDIALNEGDRLPGFEDWEILSTPGHTSIDVSLLNKKHNLIYVADLIVSVKGKLSPPYPVHFPDRYAQSIRKLKQFVGFNMSMAHVEDTVLTTDTISYITQNVPNEPQSALSAIKEKLLKIR